MTQAKNYVGHSIQFIFLHPELSKLTIYNIQTFEQSRWNIWTKQMKLESYENCLISIKNDSVTVDRKNDTVYIRLGLYFCPKRLS